MLDEDLNEIPDENGVILRSYNSLGHGIMNEVFYDVVYVKNGQL